MKINAERKISATCIWSSDPPLFIYLDWKNARSPPTWRIWLVISKAANKRRPHSVFPPRLSETALWLCMYRWLQPYSLAESRTYPSSLHTLSQRLFWRLAPAQASKEHVFSQCTGTLHISIFSVVQRTVRLLARRPPWARHQFAAWWGRSKTLKRLGDYVHGSNAFPQTTTRMLHPGHIIQLFCHCDRRGCLQPMMHWN